VPGMTPEEHWPRPQIEVIEGLKLSEEDKANILYRNACRMLEIEAIGRARDRFYLSIKCSP